MFTTWEHVSSVAAQLASTFSDIDIYVPVPFHWEPHADGRGTYFTEAFSDVEHIEGEWYRHAHGFLVQKQGVGSLQRILVDGSMLKDPTKLAMGWKELEQLDMLVPLEQFYSECF